jgi:hypothetical protein
MIGPGISIGLRKDLAGSTYRGQIAGGEEEEEKKRAEKRGDQRKA